MRAHDFVVQRSRKALYQNVHGRTDTDSTSVYVYTYVQAADAHAQSGYGTVVVESVSDIWVGNAHSNHIDDVTSCKISVYRNGEGGGGC